MVSYFCKNCNIKVEKSECSICGKRAELKSELFWCETCNIPTYTEECPICHGHGKYFTSDARPVFPEERLLVETLLGKPLAFINDSVWNGSGNRYYVNGKKVPLSISKIDELNPEEIRNTIKKYESQNIYSTFDSMIEKWVTANSTHFDFITTEAKQYIAGFSKKYVNDETNAAFVSFSGGKDSTVVSDLVRKALGNPSIIHIFGNTTLEFPQTYEYIERFKKTNRKTPLLRAENKEQDFFIITTDYVLNLEPGKFIAVLDMKAEARNCLRVFFTFEDSRKVMATTQWWQRYLGFYEIPVGTHLLLHYRENSRKEVYLDEVERI